MDIKDFADTFFEEAEELLADMERHLLEIDLDAPDPEQLNAIFRAAHSIKGGAGTFGFDTLQKTTHIFENLLDYTRQGELTLRKDLVDTFLETKDMLHNQLDAYRNEEEPDPEAFQRICQTLQQIAREEIGRELEGGADTAAAAPGGGGPAANGTSSAAAEATADDAGSDDAGSAPASEATGSGDGRRLLVTLLNVGEKDRGLLVEELGQLGTIEHEQGDDSRYEVTLLTVDSQDDIEAVMCFIVEPEQLEIRDAPPPAGPATPPAPAAEPASEAPKAETAPVAKPAAGSGDDGSKDKHKGGGGGRRKAGGESSSIRVSVEKVDQIINLVGELIITQSMLDQTVSELEGVNHNGLVNGMNLLQRNARDLQEAVMSIRMVPMDYVFSRYPRLVRDLAGKLDKDVELITEGESTELDKSLTERIIDPLTHLVRNSLDHGIEPPDEREALGKPRTGTLTLSARHQGGNILIEVIDDGAGLDREKLLAKARDSGVTVSDNMTDDEVWQLIFAAGFSTANEVSDVSGRGVGMDVVKRNIQALGGHIEIKSKLGEGTTTRVALPLTLAILDGMSIKVGEEMFILPLSAVLESLQPSADDVYAMAGDDVVLKVRDEYLPVVAVHEAMDVANANTKIEDCIAVIMQGEGRRYALLVDELIGQQQVVVKNLETNYRKVPGVSAATILGDGRVALILDVADIHRLNRAKKEAKRPTRNTIDYERLFRREGETS